MSAAHAMKNALVLAGSLLAATALANETAAAQMPSAPEVQAPAAEVAAPTLTPAPEPAPSASAVLADSLSPPLSVKAPAKPGFLDRWMTFARGEVDRIIASEPYGSTFMLPKGYLKLKYSWAGLHGDSRYDGDGKLGPVVPPLEFQLGGQPELSVDLAVGGQGGSHAFQLGYGILDNFGWFAEIPYNYMSLRMDPQVNAVDEEGNHIGPTAASFLGVSDRKNYGPANFLYETLPQLGRPPLPSGVRAQWLLGDINTGVAWNYYRTKFMSTAVTGRLFLPSAHIPPPERNLLYATGPEIEVGMGGWGLAATQSYDVRAFRNGWLEVVAGSDLSARYQFPQRRPYPTNFIKPDSTAAAISPQMFPDLSELKGSFKLNPGWGLGWNSRLDVGLGLVGVSFGYGIKYGQKPVLQGDPYFVGMVNSLGLLGDSEVHTVQIATGFSLIPLAIPARITVDWQRVVGGRNVLLYEDHFTFSFEGLIPTQFFFRP